MADQLFQGAPTAVWQLHDDGAAMAESHQELLTWIRGVVAAQGQAENANGALNVYTAMSGGIEYPKDLTAEGGFFIVVMRAPEGWEGRDQDLPLAFSCKNLYLLGFRRADTWYFFKDADLRGSGHDADDVVEGVAWERLCFYGGYSGDKFEEVQLGIYELWLSFYTLTRYPGPSISEIDNATFRIMVVISEAVRFPYWNNHLIGLLTRGWSPEVVDAKAPFSLLFKNWSAIGKRVQEGEEAFVAGKRFDTYRQLLNSIRLIKNDGGVT